MTLIRSFALTLILLSATLVLWAPVATAQEETKSVQFTAPATEAPAGSDTKSLLVACDNRVDICERDAVGVPYLAAAYMAIWAILMAFLIVIRRGQRRLEGELKELERRLDDPSGVPQ